MSSFDGSKRQRTDGRHSSSPAPISPKTHPAEPGSGAGTGTGSSAALVSAANSAEHLVIHELLERLLAKQERIAADVVRLQSTVDTILTTLRHTYVPQRTALQQQQQPERYPLSVAPQSTAQSSPSQTWSPAHPNPAVPPTLANIVSLGDEPPSSHSSTTPSQSASRGLPPMSPSTTSAAASVSPKLLHPQLGTIGGVHDNIASNNPENGGSSSSSDSRLSSHPHYAHEFQQP
ncbi:hypothetical protein GGH95_004988, partial [Coemansia sp. RSA 1836]